MAEGPPLHPKLQMVSNIPIEMSSQMPQEPARNLLFQMCQSPPVTPGSTMQSNLSVPERNLLQQESPGPSRQSGCMPVSDEYGDKQTVPMAPRKCRKERTVYSKEQQRLLQKHFDECQCPNEEKILQLAVLVGVTKTEIKIWFKNNRAKYKRMNLQNIEQALPGTNGSSQAVSESTHFPGSIPVVAADKGKSMCPGTFAEDSISKLNCSQESFLPHYQACDGDLCRQQEDLLVGHSPVTAGDSGQSAVVESQSDLAVAEAPVSLAYATQAPEYAQDSSPSGEELWQMILNDLDTSDDWLTLNQPSNPVYTSELLDQSRPDSDQEVTYMDL